MCCNYGIECAFPTTHQPSPNSCSTSTTAAAHGTRHDSYRTTSKQTPPPSNPQHLKPATNQNCFMSARPSSGHNLFRKGEQSQQHCLLWHTHYGKHRLPKMHGRCGVQLQWDAPNLHALCTCTTGTLLLPYLPRGKHNQPPIWASRMPWLWVWHAHASSQTTSRVHCSLLGC